MKKFIQEHVVGARKGYGLEWRRNDLRAKSGERG